MLRQSLRVFTPPDQHVIDESSALRQPAEPPPAATASPVTPDVDVGVIYTSEDDYMPRLLDTLAGSAVRVVPRLILVDNATREGTRAWRGFFRHELFLRNSRRLNYGQNLNRILSASSAPYILLLNTDMYFDPLERCVDRMVAFMDEHPECGIAGCRLYHADGLFAYPARRFPTVPMIAARRLPLTDHLLQQHARELLYAEREPTEVFECDWLSGCLLMVRRAAYEQTGGLDERFVKYFEDVDFCARVGARGWRVMFNGGTYAYHLEQRSSRRVLSFDAMLHLRSYWRWLAKWGFDPHGEVTRRRTQVLRAA